MNVVFICPYPTGTAPSQRFRFEQYLPLLREKNITCRIEPFFRRQANASSIGISSLSGWAAVLGGYTRRLVLLLKMGQYDIIFIHREATPAGPPLFEWVVAKLLRKKIIYDFDDAIWTTDKIKEPVLQRILRCRWKVGKICSWSTVVSCGNRYLATYAGQFNNSVIINPTTIDFRSLESERTGKINSAKTVIGWTGSHSTLKYLGKLYPILQALEEKHANVQWLVIADKNPAPPLKNFHFRQWAKETEIFDLSPIDIGIMPLPDDEWTRGKCGFKALQYMALEIPAVVSPVGVNTEIVEHGVEGYLCQSDADWYNYLEDLILNPAKRREMGKKGKAKVQERYSATANSENFLSLFRYA